MKKEKLQNKQLVVVLGMHRSGTSVVTRGLQVLGVDLGVSLMSASAGNNDKGFWEDTGFNELNVELLASIGHEWHSLAPVLEDEWRQPVVESFRLRAIELLRARFAGVDCFGVKDPRMARTLPFWQPIFAHMGLRVGYVIACRNPANVVHSLAQRDGFELEKGYLLWLEHMLLSLRYSQGEPRVFVDYDRVLQAPVRELQRMARVLNLPFDETSEEMTLYQQDFLEVSLCHHQYHLEDLPFDQAAPRAVIDFSRQLFALADDKAADDEALASDVERHCEVLAEHQQTYRLLRRYDERSIEVSHALHERDRQLQELSLTLQIREQQLHEAESGSRDQRQQLDLLQKDLDDARLLVAQQAAGLIHEHEQACLQLQTQLARLESPRFLLKALSRVILERSCLPGLRGERWLRQRMLQTGLFDVGFYRQQNPDVAAAGVDPLQHYLDQGWREGRDPSAGFSARGYLELYQDVRMLGIDPLAHYLRHGRQEGRAILGADGEPWHLPAEKTLLQLLFDALRLVRNRPELVQSFWREARSGGVRYALRLVRSKLQLAFPPPPLWHASNVAAMQNDRLQHEIYRVVPFYLDPYLTKLPQLVRRRVAVHLHLYYEDMTERCINYLRNVPVDFDLYVSLPEGRDTQACQIKLREGIPRAGKVIVEGIPNRGRDVAPFIIQFGARLAEYDYIGHFHTKKSPHRASLEGWFDALMEVLCGSETTVAQIFQLLDGDGKVVYPAGNQVVAWDTGWSDNYEIARQLLTRYTDLRIEDFPCVEFPQGTMFWSKASCLREFLALPLRYQDFPEEPIAPDATLAHALERLPLIFSSLHEGRNYRLESAQLSCEPLDYYEEQYDYSTSIAYDSIKVLAYYLPQFHPTPENDTWHGEGFTEWYKVRSANPLFQGHYQQHIPHPDIGYYHLDSPQQLECQAGLMHKAGVHGLIFYHYWFSGRLILENPAQMLLANPQIDMPFCFCWANENWTRRWDGNEREILLGQDYSADDARAFIHYLLPFFRDARYIRVEGRPLLFVYRPSSMEHCADYLRIWREECEREGVAAPYVVATLTRGATSPKDYGMDAAVERVLHDWTGGAVPDISGRLTAYQTLSCSVLDYTAVAEHYIGKPLDNDYPLFRSLVPTWDNTARYCAQAHVLHGFTPPVMQRWMEELIRYSEQHLPADRRFVVVNAWNEWAEGAHLEPDTRFGYAYLNTIGRALCGYAFDDFSYLRPAAGLRLALQLDGEIESRLQSEPRNREAFLRCLAAAVRAGGYRLVISQRDLADALRGMGVECEDAGSEEAELVLAFEVPVLFPVQALDALVRMALRHCGFHISANLLNAPDCVHDEQLVNAACGFRQRAGMELRPLKGLKGYKVCAQASCFRLLASQADESTLETVRTVVRFHNSGKRSLLLNALYSLQAQRDCRVQPWIALQDMSDEEVAELQAELQELPWYVGCEPVLRRYSSSAEQPDLRSLMLNDTIKAIGQGFAAFLDYDDILFPDAYATLLHRLTSSSKNASFGRVYSTTVDLVSGLVIGRERVYDYGHTYEEFVLHNHAPLHSFMLNLDLIDLTCINYFDDMKYLEDYYLTLQVFTPEGTDWDSLYQGNFIGDYIHRRGDKSHTLAVTDQGDRRRLLKDDDYIRCEARIIALRKRLGRSTYSCT